MAVSKRLRFEVLRRDSHTCRYCGAKAPDATLRIDHVKPVALGGLDVPENLVTACFDCNAGKSSVPADAAVVADVAADALRWVAAIKQAQEELWNDLCHEHESNMAIRHVWNGWRDSRGKTVPLPPDWETTLNNLRRAGLWSEVIEICVGIAMRSQAAHADKWRYFCGVCWRKLDEQNARAQELAEQAP